MHVNRQVAATYREVSRAAFLGLAVNVALGAVKLVGGVVSGSFALISDALNSWGDVLSSMIVLGALRVAQRPPDAQHPYGYARAEAVAGSNVALIIILSALGLGWQVVRQTSTAHESPPLWTLWIAGANVIIKEALYRYKLRVARRTGSQAIMANAWDHRSDALCSLVVLLGLGLVRLGGEQYKWADHAAALVVVAVIVGSGVMLLRNSAFELMDAQAPQELLDEIRATALGVPGVKGVEKLWTRKAGLEYFADVHIEVEPTITVADGHRIGHVVKARLREQFPMLRDALIHLEPFEG